MLLVYTVAIIGIVICSILTYAHFTTVRMEKKTGQQIWDEGRHGCWCHDALDKLKECVAKSGCNDPFVLEFIRECEESKKTHGYNLVESR